MKKFVVGLAMLVAAGSAFAKPGNGNGNNDNGGGGGGATAGGSSLADAKLAGKVAKDYVWSDGINPNQGPNGNTTGFNVAFSDEAKSAASVWSLVGKATGDVSSQSATINGATLTWGFDVAETNNKSGAFWIKSNKSIVFDLALAVHAANASGAWLFDNFTLKADTVKYGAFAINWTNGGGNVPAFSNATFFARDVAATTVTPVPEPDAYAMIFVALGAMTMLARRKRSK